MLPQLGVSPASIPAACSGIRTPHIAGSLQLRGVSPHTETLLVGCKGLMGHPLVVVLFVHPCGP